MIFDGISYREYLYGLSRSSRNDAIVAFVDFVERRLGGVMMFPLSKAPLGEVGHLATFRIATTLKDAGIITSFARIRNIPDEPQFRFWEVIGNDSNQSRTSGMSLRDTDALYAALAEGLERHLWLMEVDYFDSLARMTVSEAAGLGMTTLLPEQFVGFKPTKAAHGSREAIYAWIIGRSLLTGERVRLPAQTSSGADLSSIGHEHSFRERTTAGLATWPTQTGAQLAGLLELIEHDAYMIMWFNQLTLPRLSLDSVSKMSHSLATLIEDCKRYQLTVHAIPMITDAPTHAICVVVEDHSGSKPRFTVGLRAHNKLALCIEKALLEALRARIHYRSTVSARLLDSKTPITQITHGQRVAYWAFEKHASHLQFLITGTQIDAEINPWEQDTDKEHLARLLNWCRGRQYECVSVSLSTPKNNPLAWHVEKIIVPDLQPLHLEEKNRVLTGKRLADIPATRGFVPRSEPFIAMPHPFF